jgi:amino acid adenylation domain-containing protein
MQELPQVLEGTVVRAGPDLATDVLEAVLSFADLTPEHPAAKDDDDELTYAQLRDAVASLAAGLDRLGVTPGDRVGLHLPNSVDFLVAALACLWVGAIFVPLAVTDPPARVGGIVEDCAPTVVLSNAAISDPYPTAVEVSEVAASEPAPVVDPDDRPAYAIYTSGTTGAPKGVVIGRRAFAAAVRSCIRELGMDQNTRSLCVSPFHFDGSFGTLFPTAVAGGALIIPPRESLLFPRYFFRTVAREQINLTSFSPSYLRLLLANTRLSSLTDTSLRVIGIGGEACSAADVRRLWAAVPGVRVFNRYGPTETTIMASHFEVTPESIDGGDVVPIGVPHPDVTFHLVADDGHVIDGPDEPGELYIGGIQLMAGYWGAPELTASVMRTDVISGQLVYRTGDIVLRQRDGNYAYVDRADRVVKRRSVRISLVEVSEVMSRLPGVQAATCVIYDNEGELGIAAFVVTEPGRTAEQLRRAAADQLPATMIPDRIELVDELPLASSSKVDERRLLREAGLTQR